MLFLVSCLIVCLFVCLFVCLSGNTFDLISFRVNRMRRITNALRAGDEGHCCRDLRDRSVDYENGTSICTILCTKKSVLMCVGQCDVCIVCVCVCVCLSVCVCDMKLFEVGVGTAVLFMNNTMIHTGGRAGWVSGLVGG